MDKKGTVGERGTIGPTGTRRIITDTAAMTALGLLPGMLSRRPRKAPKAKTPKKLTTDQTFLRRYKSYYKMQKIGHGWE